MAQQARHETRVEAGVARIEQPGTRPRSAVVLSATRHHADSVLAALLALGVTGARDSVAAAQIIGALAWRPSGGSAWQVEGGASAASFQLTSFGSHGNGNGWLRLRRQITQNIGAMASGSLGHTIRGSTSGHTSAIDVGAWMTGGAFTFDLSLSRLRTEDSLLMAASQVFTRQRSAWLDTRDIALTAAWNHGPLELSATQRWRAGMLGTDASQSALAAAATYAFTPRVSLVLGAGRHLADPVRGGPDATMLSAAIRLAFTDVPNEAPPASESAVSIARMTDGSVLIVRITAPANARVEVAGSFSGWEPVPITRKEGFWEAQVGVPPGRHRVAYRINGENWRAPTGLARLREFGGEVGLIVIP